MSVSSTYQITSLIVETFERGATGVEIYCCMSLMSTSDFCSCGWVEVWVDIWPSQLRLSSGVAEKLSRNLSEGLGYGLDISLRVRTAALEMSSCEVGKRRNCCRMVL
jgi:hypothetical protein